MNGAPESTQWTLRSILKGFSEGKPEAASKASCEAMDKDKNKDKDKDKEAASKTRSKAKDKDKFNARSQAKDKDKDKDNEVLGQATLCTWPWDKVL